jgi:hypothetical protein
MATIATTNPQTRKPWIRPAVEKIAAGRAEAGTRNNRQDAEFQSS